MKQLALALAFSVSFAISAVGAPAAPRTLNDPPIVSDCFEPAEVIGVMRQNGPTRVATLSGALATALLVMAVDRLGPLPPELADAISPKVALAAIIGDLQTGRDVGRVAFFDTNRCFVVGAQLPAEAVLAFVGIAI